MVEVTLYKYLTALILISLSIYYFYKNGNCVNFVSTDNKYIISYSHLNAMTFTSIELSEIRFLPERCISINSSYLDDLLDDVHSSTNEDIRSYVLILKRVEDKRIFYFGYFSPKYNEMLIVDSKTNKKYVLNDSQIKKLVQEIEKSTLDVRPIWWLKYDYSS
jgi:hypothetical protein